jgi:hypothetical protein
MRKTPSLIQSERIEQAILLLRGEKVMLDADLAEMYGVESRALLQAVKRNRDRFPEDFMFQLSDDEFEALRSQFAASNQNKGLALQGVATLRSQSVISKGRGGRRYNPYVFTEQGVAMLSSVLNSPRAVVVNIEIMRAFVRLRKWIASHAELAAKLSGLEKKYDAESRIVFDAIRELMNPPSPASKKRIGS